MPIFIHIIFFIIFCYLLVSTVYLFVIAIAGRIIKPVVYTPQTAKKRIAVIIPSFREDEIIFHTALEAVNHDYPKTHFEVFVVADQLRVDTISRLKSIVHVIEVQASMKSKSLHAAFTEIENSGFDIAVILDADNIMEAGCLEKINDAYLKGHKAIQCHRSAKNKNTAVALLDAISEEININLFRRGPSVMGLSAAPIGSGMAFDFNLIHEIFSLGHILNNPGEDREIDMQLMKRKIKMEFIDDAIVYDEKVSTSKVFQQQRTRWLEAQVNHVTRFFDSDMKSAPKTVLYFNKFFQNLLLPRLLFLIVFSLIFLVLVAGQIFTINILFPSSFLWLTIMLLYLCTLCISVPIKFYNADTVKAIIHIPVLMLSMVRALLKMKRNRREFLHTPKNIIAK